MRKSAAAVVTAALLASGAAVAGPAQAATAASPDHVLDWNQVLRTQFTLVCGADGAPGPLTRAGAMMHTAIWDAVNSISGGSNPAYGFYLGRVSAPAGASVEAAIDQAAHDTLVAAFPGQQASFYKGIDDARDKELAYIPDGQQKTDGRAVGVLAAKAVVNARAGDFTKGYGGTYPADADQTLGRWRPTDTSWAAATPNWGLLQPFALTSGNQFQPQLPAGYSSYSALLASPEYAAQVNEVKAIGSLGSTTRLPDQTEAAQFWANDLGPDCGINHNTFVSAGSYKPPGQLFETTAAVAQVQNLGEFANARLFALVGVALADASITAWDAKYDTPIQLWRPVTAIQLAGQVGNSAVTADPTWAPLSHDTKNVPFTPPFPSYVSGHATFAGAWGSVMRDYFGDNVSFTAHTDPQLSSTMTRSYTSISSAATEDAFSRLWLGVHYRFDTEQGLAAGSSVGDWAYHNALKPTGAIAYQGSVATSAAATSGTSVTLPVTRAVRGGDTLLVSAMLTNTHSGAITATDTQGNVYSIVQPSNRTDGSSDRTLVLTSIGVKPLSTSDTITLTYPTTGEHHVSVQEFSGVTAVDQSTSATGAAGTAFNSGSTATTTAANELVFGVAGVQGGENVAWGAGFTAQPTLFVSEDQLATAYQIVNSTGSYAATGTATHQWTSAVVTLR
ncbi:vanadium-dependent haloperoxidase [Kitasatospora sp. McL0602]|uniref:vanadium-dependent haloperoxidase n=1 Tax=Kitasatospora sp. McL0602 TaxID=3439530 RepID=UPI003F8A9C4B